MPTPAETCLSSGRTWPRWRELPGKSAGELECECEGERMVLTCVNRDPETLWWSQEPGIANLPPKGVALKYLTLRLERPAFVVACHAVSVGGISSDFKTL